MTQVTMYTNNMTKDIREIAAMLLTSRCKSHNALSREQLRCAVDFLNTIRDKSFSFDPESNEIKYTGSAVLNLAEVLQEINMAPDNDNGLSSVCALILGHKFDSAKAQSSSVQEIAL